MREHVADVHLAAIEMDRGNEPILVTVDIEHDQIPHFVRRWERMAQFIEAGEVRVLHDPEPPGKRSLTIRMPFPKPTQRLARDNVHRAIVSQDEINGNTGFDTPCRTGYNHATDYPRER
jgi:hypothetical protein